LVFSAVPGTSTDGTGQLSATVSAYTNAEDWFSFHEDHGAHEERDQSMLKRVWSRMHLAMPELGDGIELIETATPQTYYEATRRRFGMIGRLASASGITGSDGLTTPYPAVFLVGDTVSKGLGLEGVTQSAWHTANEIAAIDS